MNQHKITLTSVLLGPVSWTQLTQCGPRSVPWGPFIGRDVCEAGKFIQGNPLLFSDTRESWEGVKYGLKQESSNLNIFP